MQKRIVHLILYLGIMAHKKNFLPEKICLVCMRPFTWRKKWERVWTEVKYCSDACRKSAKHKTNQL